VAILTRHGNFLAFFLQLLVAAEAGSVRLLAVECLVEALRIALGALGSIGVATFNGATADGVLGLCRVVAGHTVNFSVNVLFVGEIHGGFLHVDTLRGLQNHVICGSITGDNGRQRENADQSGNHQADHQ